MSKVVEYVGDVLESAASTFKEIAQDAWDDVVMPIAEEVFGILGINDETLVDGDKISIKLYSKSTVLPSKQAVTRAVLSKSIDTDPDNSFYDHYWFHINSTKVSLTSFYKYGESKYTHGLPDSTVHGTYISNSGAANAVITEFGPDAVVLNSTTGFPTELQHFRNVLQAAPYFYKPPSQTLTYTDSATSTVYTDWRISDIFFNTVDYEITLERTALLAEFWITGSANVTEGDTATYTVHCTRTVPVGKTVTINLVYGGAAPGTDYTAVASVVMLANTNEVSFSVPTTENALVDGGRTFTVSIGTIDNSAIAFQAVAARTPSTVSTLIHDDESPALRVIDGTVAEGASSITVEVALIDTPGVGFTVDYSTVAGTALAGADYVSTSGTLTFAGTLNEVQSFPVTILSDLVDDSGETFFIQLSNCSDPSVDITSQGIVTITDDSEDFDPITSITSEVLVQPNFTPESSVIIEYHLSNTDPLALNWKYWIYRVASNTYPALKPISNKTTEFELFPAILLRKNKVNITSYGSAEEIASTKKILEKLKLPLDIVMKSINDNPDVALINDAYINLAVNPTDTGPLISKLLWHLFYPVVVEHPVESNDNKYFLTMEQQSIQNSVVWSEQEYIPLTTGVIGPIDTYTHAITTLEYEVEQDDGDGGTEIVIETTKVLTVRRQKDATRYETIKITSLNGISTINYGTAHEVVANTLGDANFTIPVSWYSFNKLTAKEQADAAEHIIRLDIYALRITELEWYETEQFQNFVSVILIAVTVATLGQTAYLSAGYAAAAGLSAGQVVLVTVAVVTTEIAVGYTVARVVSKIAEKYGGEAAAVAGTTLTVLLTKGGAGKNLLKSMLNAKELLAISTEFAKNLIAGYQIEIATEIKALDKEKATFEAAYNTALDELKEAEYTPRIDPKFVAALRSVDTLVAEALTVIYDYDTLFDYDSYITDYNEDLLRIGVV